jgi:CubicO group peptidase (beta-lactamase class C family)
VNDRLDQVIASGNAPGLQYIAVDSHKILTEYAGGWADVSGRRQMELDTTMMLYSMTKTFTAAAVLQLVEQGKVRLEDPALKYVADMPYGNAVLIRHLLSQTSGIPHPFPLRWVHPADEQEAFDERAALAAVLRRNSRLNFPPGDKYHYSNISYWLLGRVIEKASGTSFEDYVRRNIFARLGILPADMDFEIPSRSRHAKGYIPKYSLMNLLKSFFLDSRYFGSYEGRWLHIRDHFLNGPAYGGIVASGRALAAFLQDQLRETSVLFTGKTRAMFFEQQKSNDGALLPMTLGWHVGSLDERWHYYKEGGGGGYHGEMRIYPDRAIATMVIGNSAAFKAGKLLNMADRELL